MVGNSHQAAGTAPSDGMHLYSAAVHIARASGSLSAFTLQQHLLISHHYACRLLEAMETEGIVGPINTHGLCEVLPE